MQGVPHIGSMGHTGSHTHRVYGSHRVTHIGSMGHTEIYTNTHTQHTHWVCVSWCEVVCGMVCSVSHIGSMGSHRVTNIGSMRVYAGHTHQSALVTQG